MRQDEYRDQIAAVFADLGVTDRTERVRLYRFARAVLRLGLADISEPRVPLGRASALLDLEGAIRDSERHFSAPTEAQLALTLTSPTSPPSRPSWPGQGHVLATLVTRNIRIMLARDPLAYLWLFLAPALTIAAVLGR